MNAPRGAATAATAAKKAAKTAKLAAAASTLGLGLVALVGAAATLLPRHLLDACNWTRHPDVRRAFSTDECYRLLDAAVQAAPKAARREAADVLFHLVESTRREGALWLGLGLGSLYALAVPFDQRHSALFVLAASGSPAARIVPRGAGADPRSVAAQVARGPRRREPRRAPRLRRDGDAHGPGAVGRPGPLRLLARRAAVPLGGMRRLAGQGPGQGRAHGPDPHRAAEGLQRG